ncbi:MAG TPA: SRPBCC family protein [Actinomycetota bacterium]|nr:SRPBCC family protein [Actinomycetota bacterium]
MPDLNFYRFHSEWSVPAGFERTYEVLRNLPTYAAWWPEVKSVIPISEDQAVVLIMGLLPYSLEFLMDRQVDDPEAGILKARMRGDLEGFSSWRVERSDGGCRLVYDQEVEVAKKLLRKLAPVARPLFIANHALMMRRGESGLRKYLQSAAE